MADIEALRDAVVASRAVVQYLMHKDKYTAEEQAYVVEYANYGEKKAAPLLKKKGVDAAKVGEFIKGIEVQAWMEAERDYQNGKK